MNQKGDQSERNSIRRTTTSCETNNRLEKILQNKVSGHQADL